MGLSKTLIVTILLLCVSFSLKSQELLGSFPFGTLTHVYSSYTAKEGKLFLVTFKVEPSNPNFTFDNASLELDPVYQLTSKVGTIQSIDGMKYLHFEVVRGASFSSKKKKINSKLLFTTSIKIENILQRTEHQIPFSFTLIHR